MKKLFTFLAVFSFLSTQAQTKVSEKAVIKVPTVQCEMCKERLENRLTHEYGVQTARVDVRRKTLTVTWLTDRTNLETIKEIVSVTGYDADDVVADPVAYAKLPKCCKKPEPKKEAPKKK